MSYLRKPSPKAGVYPIPGFADTFTLSWAQPYQTDTQGGGPGLGPIALVTLVDRTLSTVAQTFWTYGGFFVFGGGLLIGRDRSVIPNGAEYWFVTTPLPGPFSSLPEVDRINLRFHLHT